MPRPSLRHIAHLSTVLTAALAAFGLVIAVWQIRAAESSQREASARDAYKEYLKLAIEKPDLTDLQLPSAMDPEARKVAQENFFSFYLFSAEQIYETFSADPGWQRSLQTDLCGFHHDLNDRFAHWQWHQHEPEFAQFAQETLAQCTSLLTQDTAEAE